MTRPAESTTDGFGVHTGAMHAHAGRLRDAATRFGSASDAAATGPGAVGAFGLIGGPLAVTVLGLADRAADGLAVHAGLVRAVADGVDRMAATYTAAERAVRDGLRR